MSRQIPNPERIERARALIQEARLLPVPVESGKFNITYLAQLKGLLQQARDLVKFIQYSPSASPEMKKEVMSILEEADQANNDILHRS
jgi:hypothetical protein